MKVSRFEWDENNIGHIARHDVEPGEAEEVFANFPLYRKVKGNRLTACGQTDSGRYLFVVFERKPGNLICVVTARDMNLSERRYYRRMKGER
ncbi:MAG: BrnT family toxin [Bacillota bacterium]